MLSCESFLSISFDLFQMPDGRWAGRGRNEEGEVIYISKKSFPKGETPERFKYEPAEIADEKTTLLYYKLTY
jgi:hypothetical protein